MTKNIMLDLPLLYFILQIKVFNWPILYNIEQSPFPEAGRRSPLGRRRHKQSYRESCNVCSILIFLSLFPPFEALRNVKN